ncbi:aminotransferase class V-fold PLP-dependent enzyme, partial [Kamptonema animale CS-326]
VELTAYLFQKLREIPDIKLYGPKPDINGEGRAALAAFNVGDLHPHDLSEMLDQAGVAIRAGNHCTQPLHRYLCIRASARASLYFYNTREEIDVFIAALKDAIDFFGSNF